MNATGVLIISIAVLLASAVVFVVSLRGKGPKPEKLMYFFEFLAGVTLVAAFLVCAGIFDGAIAVMWFIAMILSLFSLAASRRAGSSYDARGDLMRGGMVLGAAGAALLVVVIAGGVLSVAFGNAYSAAGSFFGSLWRGINSLLEKWAALMPEDDMEVDVTDALNAAGEAYSTGGGSSAIAGGRQMALGVVVLIIIVVAVYIVARIIINRGKSGASVEKKTGRPEARSRKKKEGVLAAFVRKKVWYVKNRNNPFGMLIWLEGFMKKKGSPRAEGESSESFLKRVGDANPSVRETLCDISAWIDKSFFSVSGAEESAFDISSLKKSIRKL